MVIWSESRMGRHRDDNPREDVPDLNWGSRLTKSVEGFFWIAWDPILRMFFQMHDWDLSAAIATTMAPEPNRAGAPVANIDTEESIPTVESESNDSIHSLFGSRSDNDGIRNRDVPEAPPIGPIQLPPNNQTVSEY